MPEPDSDSVTDILMRGMNALTTLMEATLAVPPSDELAVAADVDEIVAVCCLDEMRNAFIDFLIGLQLRRRHNDDESSFC